MKERKVSKNNSDELFSSGRRFYIDSHYYGTIVDFSSFPGILETSATGLPPGG